MKYIRTKLGVYDEEKVNLIADAMTGEIFVEKMIDGYTSHLEQVITQADTIDELCDEFTYEYGYLKHERCWKDTYTGKWYDDDTDILLNEEEKSTIKGAIWTNKGLIYVAKMNNKGELELI